MVSKIGKAVILIIATLTCEIEEVHFTPWNKYVRTLWNQRGLSV